MTDNENNTPPQFPEIVIDGLRLVVVGEEAAPRYDVFQATLQVGVISVQDGVLRVMCPYADSPVCHTSELPPQLDADTVNGELVAAVAAIRAWLCYA